MSTLARKTARKWLGFRNRLVGKTFSNRTIDPQAHHELPERGAPPNTWTATSHAGNLRDPAVPYAMSSGGTRERPPSCDFTG